MELDTPLRYLPGIGPNLALKLAKLNLNTISDLIKHYPFRYEDYSASKDIAQVKVGEIITVSGQIWSIKNVYTRFRKILTQAILNDGSGTIELTWFNQPYLTKSIPVGAIIQISGKINKKGSKLTMLQPKWEKLTTSPTQIPISSSIHTGKIIGIYPETYGLNSKWIRMKINSIFPRVKPLLEDYLPENLKEKRVNLVDAIENIHFPKNYDDLNKAIERLSFDELFLIQLATHKKRMEWEEKQLISELKVDPKKVEKFIENLPFKLTNAQQKVVEEIIYDLKQPHPMNRLLQGDVGSGKTVVAAIAAYILSLNNLKTIIMAPTEILAFQHYQTLTKLLSPYKIEIGIYTGSKKQVEQDKTQVIVGTHAVLSEKLQVDNIGLIVVDEQQRFGVAQRSLIRNKSKSPHFLTMTATPIPRTVALTLYGDLDLSIIDELPKGRKVIQTNFVPNKKRADAYKFIAEQVKKGLQVYIITPLIEESETSKSAKAAVTEHQRLQKEIFPNLKLGILHGRLKSKEKEQILNDFKDKKIDILVSTSVVEVGVDVPNATIMLIEGADRFGLAQLHQLRGRVGRGSQQSYTFLFAENPSPTIIERLKYLETISDGLKLAEMDLKIRGSGELYGTAQSGEWSLQIATLTDLKLIEETKIAALKILTKSPKLDKYPLLLRELASLDYQVMPD